MRLSRSLDRWFLIVPLCAALGCLSGNPASVNTSLTGTWTSSSPLELVLHLQQNGSALTGQGTDQDPPGSAHAPTLVRVTGAYSYPSASLQIVTQDGTTLIGTFVGKLRDRDTLSGTLRGQSCTLKRQV
jgi:hypothetical protein